MTTYAKIDLYGNPRRRELVDRRRELAVLIRASKQQGVCASIVGREIRLIKKVGTK